MKQTNQTHETVSPVPFLFRNASPRTPGQTLPGQFDEELSVWVVGTGNNRVPIVTARNVSVLETGTKTMVQQESDDEDSPRFGEQKHVSYLSEILTKTATQQETDDEDFPRPGERQYCPHPAELQTKTFIQQESDDEADMRLLVELETKTEQQVEQDDQSRPLL